MYSVRATSPQQIGGFGIKSIGKALKKVVKPVAALALAPVTGGASVALYAADAAGNLAKKGQQEQLSLATTGLTSKEQKIAKSGKVAGSVPYNTMDANQLAAEEVRLRQMIAAGKDVKDANAKLAVLAKFQAAVGSSPSGTAADIAVTASQTGVPAETAAAVIRAKRQRAGQNPDAPISTTEIAQTMQDLQKTGVTQLPNWQENLYASGAALPPPKSDYTLPLMIGAGVLGLALVLSRKR